MFQGRHEFVTSSRPDRNRWPIYFKEIPDLFAYLALTNRQSASTIHFILFPRRPADADFQQFGGYLDPKEIPMFHTILIVGNVGKDPEMRYTPSGQAVTSFSVATNRQYTTGSGEQVKETIWFRVTTWGKQAEICNQYLRKGSKVLIEGRLTPDKNTGGPRIWNKQDGSMGASFEVTAGTVRFLSSRGEMAGEGPMMGSMEGAEIPAEDDIPF
jgi:single-strand DNA-binding protein